MKRTPVLLAGFALVAAAFGTFVWPTAYRYDRLTAGSTTTTIRTNRFTGTAERLTASGWRSSVANAAPTPVPLTPSELAALQESCRCRIDKNGQLAVQLYNGSTKDICADVTIRLVGKDYGGTVVVDRRYTAHCPFGLEGLTEGVFVADVDSVVGTAATMTYELVDARWK